MPTRSRLSRCPKSRRDRQEQGTFLALRLPVGMARSVPAATELADAKSWLRWFEECEHTGDKNRHFQHLRATSSRINWSQVVPEINIRLHSVHVHAHRSIILLSLQRVSLYPKRHGDLIGRRRRRVIRMISDVSQSPMPGRRQDYAGFQAEPIAVR